MPHSYALRKTLTHKKASQKFGVDYKSPTFSLYDINPRTYFKGILNLLRLSPTEAGLSFFIFIWAIIPSIDEISLEEEFLWKFNTLNFH